MNTRVAARRVLHLSDSPEEGRLLAVELEEAESVELVRVDSRTALRRAIEGGAVDLVVADLPLCWPRAHDDLAELQRTHPEIEVIFRWGEPGARNAEPENAQIQRLVLERLHDRPTRPQSEPERRAVMRELARRQDVLLRLQRRPLLDFDEALRDVTRTAAELLDVERVSVWEFSSDHASLECALLYRRGDNAYERGAVLTTPKRYMRALETSVSLVAHDCQRDPRTSDLARDYLVPLGIPSLLDSPVRVDGEVRGVLCLEHVGAPRRWSILDQCAASSLAGQVARAYEVRRRREAEDRARALERLDALGRVAGQLAHDFNNRLTVLAGWVGLLRHDLHAGASAEQCLSELERELEQAAQHVRELLDLGQSSAPRENCELGQELERLAPMLSRVLGDGVAFDLEVNSGRSVVALAPRELESVLVNLALNARDALAGQGRVSLRVDESVGDGAPALRLSFEDDGPGFSPAALAHAFEPLFTTKRSGAGAGLGLSSVARVVRNAGGAVQISNARPRGARIQIELPRSS